MPETESLPCIWKRELDRSEFDSFMDREYTALVFAHSSTDRKVIISDVQEPNKFEGWDYLVRVTDPEYGELDLVDDIETVREIAIEFIEEHAG